MHSFYITKQFQNYFSEKYLTSFKLLSMRRLLALYNNQSVIDNFMTKFDYKVQHIVSNSLKNGSTSKFRLDEAYWMNFKIYLCWFRP